MTKVILNLGMGIDSSAILTRLLLEPEVRDFVARSCKSRRT